MNSLVFIGCLVALSSLVSLACLICNGIATLLRPRRSKVTALAKLRASKERVLAYRRSIAHAWTESPIKARAQGVNKRE